MAMGEIWIPVRIKADYYEDAELPKILRGMMAPAKSISGEKKVTFDVMLNRYCRSEVETLENAHIEEQLVKSWIDSLLNLTMYRGAVIDCCDAPADKTGKKAFARMLTMLHAFWSAAMETETLTRTERSMEASAKKTVKTTTGYRWIKAMYPDYPNSTFNRIYELIRKFMNINEKTLQEISGKHTGKAMQWWQNYDVTVYRMEKKLMREFLEKETIEDSNLVEAVQKLKAICHKTEFPPETLDKIFEICRKALTDIMEYEYPVCMNDAMGLCYNARNLREILSVWTAVRPGVEFRICPICGTAFRVEAGAKMRYCGNHTIGKIRYFQQMKKKNEGGGSSESVKNKTVNQENQPKRIDD